MPSAGQASAEYTAILALVAAALAGVGALAGLDGVAQAVEGGVRTGICIVGGDVCRQSDAERAGLAPCTVAERSEGGGAIITFVSLRFGGSDRWTVARRSDGSVVVTRAEGRSAGVGAGIGIEASPVGIKFGAKGAYDFMLGFGRAWELPDAAAARRLLEADDDDRPPPTWRFGDLGAELTAKAGATIGGAMLTGAEASASAAAGARIGRDRTTLYVRAKLAEPELKAWLPGGARTAGGASRDVLVEITRERGALRELAFRKVEPGRDGTVVETVARLDLRAHSNRAAVAPLLRVPLPWPASVLGDLRAAARRAVQAGVVERAAYAVKDDSADLEFAARLGLELGLKADRVDVERRLVAASAWTDGSDERRRVDCLGGE